VIAAEATWRAAITAPSAPGESVICSTAKASAIVETPSPSAEIVVLVKTRR
jgi:hypothetical protein